jgi:hypothetical protein
VTECKKGFINTELDRKNKFLGLDMLHFEGKFLNQDYILSSAMIQVIFPTKTIKDYTGHGGNAYTTALPEDLKTVPE